MAGPLPSCILLQNFSTFVITCVVGDGIGRVLSAQNKFVKETPDSTGQGSPFQGIQVSFEKAGSCFAP